MGGTCAKCGKTLGFFDRHSAQARFAERHPEFNGGKLCSSCISEIVKKECDAHNESINAKHYGPSFSKALEQGRRIVVVKDAVFSADGIGKHIEIVSKVAEEFGYAYKSETHFPDSVGIACSFIFEKIIPTANETNFLNCENCTTRYDANQYFKCPNCGAPSKT
jgi:rubrerythrin